MFQTIGAMAEFEWALIRLRNLKPVYHSAASGLHVQSHRTRSDEASP